MHFPLSTAASDSSEVPESPLALPESEPPLEDPLLEELPLEELLLPLEEPLLEELPLLPLEEPLLGELPLEEPLPPLEALSGAAPSLDSMGLAGELVPQAWTRGAVTSAKLQMRTDRAFMLGGLCNPEALFRYAGNA